MASIQNPRRLSLPSPLVSPHDAHPDRLKYPWQPNYRFLMFTPARMTSSTSKSCVAMTGAECRICCLTM